MMASGKDNFYDYILVCLGCNPLDLPFDLWVHHVKNKKDHVKERETATYSKRKQVCILKIMLSF